MKGRKVHVIPKLVLWPFLGAGPILWDPRLRSPENDHRNGAQFWLSEGHSQMSSYFSVARKLRCQRLFTVWSRRSEKQMPLFLQMGKGVVLVSRSRSENTSASAFEGD